MKMKPEHYEVLKAKMDILLNNNTNIDIQECIDSMRKRWDLYWACGGAFSNAQEYHYLNDAHIDTAIKSILKTRLS